MAAPFLIGLLLIASGATAAGDDGARDLPHLELPGTPDSGPAHGSDALLGLPGTPDSGPAHGSDALLELPGTTPDSGPAHGSDAPPPPQGLMDIMSMSGCGRFADLVAATLNVSDIFQERIAAGGGGLTVFCPDDRAVAAFERVFRTLADSDQITVLLHHGAAGRYVRARVAGFDWVAVPTLAVADAATNERQTVLVRERGNTMRLWPTWPQDGLARVTKTVSSEEGPLVLHVVDAVLLRQKLDGGDKAARGGYLGWLHCCIPLWVVMCLFVVATVSFLAGLVAQGMVGKLRIKDTLMHIMH